MVRVRAVAQGWGQSCGLGARPAWSCTLTRDWHWAAPQGLMEPPQLQELCPTGRRALATSAFTIKAFSAYLCIGIYLWIREGNLCHSGVIAGHLQRQHKGEPWL